MFANVEWTRFYGPESEELLVGLFAVWARIMGRCAYWSLEKGGITLVWNGAADHSGMYMIRVYN